MQRNWELLSHKCQQCPMQQCQSMNTDNYECSHQRAPLHPHPAIARLIFLAAWIMQAMGTTSHTPFTITK
jgi:hypothetical protein